MSDSNWGKHLALGLSVALACAWLWLVAWSFITPLEYDPTQYATEADRKQDREDSDARAQIWAAHAAWWQVGIGLAGLVGLTFTVIFAGNAWHEAKQANKDARERHAADSRPWISVRAKIVGAWPPGQNQVDTSNASILLEVTYKNVGKSIAFNTAHATFDINAPADGFGDAKIAEIKRRMDASRQRAPGIDNVGFPLFPGEEKVVRRVVPLGMLRWGESARIPMISRLIQYRFRPQEAPLHFTPYFYDVNWHPLIADMVPIENFTLYDKPVGALPPD